MATGVSGASAGRSRPRPFKLYEPRQRAYAWIGWLLVAACCAGMIIGIVGQVVWRRVDSGYEPLAWFSGFGLFFSLLGTVNSTRPVLAVGKRGVRVRDGLTWQLIPWGEVGDVRLVRNGDYRVVVSAYAGSMTAGCAISGGTPEGTFASLAQRIREFEEWARTSPSAIGQLDYVARGSHRLREPTPSTALAHGQRHEDRAERRLARRMLGGGGVNLDGAARLISGWAPDPTGRHEIRFIKNAQWTALVMSAGLAASDGSVTGPARFDWDGPNTAPATPAANPEWLMTGIYVLRSRWSNVPSRGQPAWCSPVWAFGRTVLLVDSDRCAFTRVDTGTKYLWRRRFAGGVQVLTEHRDVLGTVPGTLGHRFRDASGNVLATRKARFVVSATGEPLASIYGVANQRPNQDNVDDTFVISVLRPIAAPLGLLILTHGLCKRPHIQPQTGGGG